MFSSSIKTYMGGPRYSANFGKVGVYGHALFGALNFSRGFPVASGTSFAFGLGGGVNYWAARHWGVRIAQVDHLRNTNWVPGTDSNPGPQPSTDFRVSTGLVVRF